MSLYLLEGYIDTEDTWYCLLEGSFEDMLKDKKVNTHYRNADELVNRGYDLRYHGYDEFRVVPRNLKKYEVTITTGYLVYSNDPDFERKLRENDARDLMADAEEVYYEALVYEVDE